MHSFIQDLTEYQVRRNPDREVVCDWDTGICYTWRDLYQRANKLAHFLVNKLKLRKGDMVGFICPTDMTMIDMFFVSHKTGIIITTYNYRLKETELIDLVVSESPRVLFFSPKSAEKIKVLQQKTNCDFIPFCVNYSHALAQYSITDLANIDGSLPVEQVDLQPEDPAMLIHTGGTTGCPKASIVSYRSLFLNAMSELITMHLTHHDCAYVCMPFYHTAGWNVFTISLLLAGGTIVLSREFSPDTFFEAVRQKRVTVFMASDTIFKILVRHPSFQSSDLSSLKWVIGGASSVSESSMQSFWSKGIPFFTGYGMTETGPNNVLPDVNMSLEQNKAKPQTVGKAMAFTQVRVVDEKDHDASVGVPGEILMRGALSFNGYWKNEQETNAIVRNGWIHTGDMGYLDGDGDLYICGRMKNMYISGGENIFPVEIEQCLERHPAIREACVFGVPDEQWGEAGKALIVLEAGAKLDTDEVKAYLVENLSTIKHPKHFGFVPAIPRCGAGKRDEHLIRKTYGTDIDQSAAENQFGRQEKSEIFPFYGEKS